MIVDNITNLRVDKYVALRRVESGEGGSVTTHITWENCTKGDVVFCEVKGKFLYAMVMAIDELFGVQVCNSKMEVLGWTQKVSGKLIEII